MWVINCNIQCTKCKENAARHALDKNACGQSCVAKHDQSSDENINKGTKVGVNISDPTVDNLDLIHNEMLAYVSHYTMKNPVYSIKTVLQESYGIGEITNARKLLLGLGLGLYVIR